MESCHRAMKPERIENLSLSRIVEEIKSQRNPNGSTSETSDGLLRDLAAARSNEGRNEALSMEALSSFLIVELTDTCRHNLRTAPF